MKKALLILGLILITAGIAFALFYVEGKKDSDVLVLYGNVDVRQVDLGFRVSGRVDKMYFEEGDPVKQGALLGTLDRQPYTDQVRQAEANVRSIRVSLANAQKVLNRRQELIKDGSVSQEDLDNSLSTVEIYTANLKQAEASLAVEISNLSYTEVRAPTEGTILTRIKEPGTVVRESDPIYTLSITSPIWIRAYIPEPYLGVVYPGMIAEIFTDTKDGPSYSAKIGFISPVAEFTPKTVETTQLRTDLVYRIRAYADNPDRGLRQGMPVTLKLQLKPKTNHEENKGAQENK